MVVSCLFHFGSSWTQGSGKRKQHTYADDLGENKSAAGLLLWVFPGGPRAPLIHGFRYGPAHKISHGLRSHKGYSLLICCSAKWQHSKFPSPLFQKPSWLPSWASLGVGSYPLHSLITLIPARVPGLNLAWPPLQGVSAVGPILGPLNP